MVNRLSNVQLIIILLLLLSAIGGLKLYDNEAIDWSFKNKYITIDPATLHFVKLDTAKTRNNTVITSNAKDWVRVKYTLPAAASFEAINRDTAWIIGNDKTDSARTWLFLNSLETVKGAMQIDGVSPYVLYNPEYELNIYSRTGDSIKVQCFVRDRQLFMRSSQNPGSIFDGRTDSLFEKVYVGKARFFPKK